MPQQTVNAADRPRAEALRSDPEVARALDALTAALSQAKGDIDRVRPSSDALRTRFGELLDDAAAQRGRPLLYPYLGSGLGNGPYVELLDGSVKLDFISGIGVHFFGHSDEDLVRTALEAALSDTVMQGHLQMNEDALAFSRILLNEARKASRLEHAFLCLSGAMANENALKICLQKNHPADRVLAFEHCFMGRSTTMAQLGDSAAGREGLPTWVHVDYVPFYDEALARSHGESVAIEHSLSRLREHLARYPGRHAVFFFELVQGEGGFNTAPPQFHRALMQCCRDHNVAVAVDEIQTFGRTTRLFCFDALGLGDLVDVATVGKMSQVCAALFTREFAPRPGLLSGTFLGSAVGLRVGARIIERLSQGDHYGDEGRIARHHERFRQGILDLAQRRPEWFPTTPAVPSVVAGHGGMMRFTPFAGEKAPILELLRTLFDLGLIAFYCGHGPHHVRFLPPLGVLEDRHWDEAFAILEEALSAVALSLQQAD